MNVFAGSSASVAALVTAAWRPVLLTVNVEPAGSPLLTDQVTLFPAPSATSTGAASATGRMTTGIRIVWFPDAAFRIM